MSDDQVGREWVSVSSGTGLPVLSRTKAAKRLCVCVCVNDAFYNGIQKSAVNGNLHIFKVPD